MKIAGNISIVFLFLVNIFSADAQTISAMSYNIRMDTSNDGENQWTHRKVELVKLINESHPDFFGLQEAMFHQRLYVDSCLSKYNQIGLGRDDGKNKGEATPVFYNAKKYKLIQQSTFFLSETPESVSVGWDASYNRICTYGLFEHNKSGQKIWVFNTHFDHRGEEARQNSAKLILSRIKTLVGEKEPVIVLGDFNATPDSKPYKILTKSLDDAMTISSKIKGPSGTFNGFETDSKLNYRIDYVFVKNVVVKSFAHIDDRRKNGLWVSDHLPVFVELYIGAKRITKKVIKN